MGRCVYASMHPIRDWCIGECFAHLGRLILLRRPDIGEVRCIEACRPKAARVSVMLAVDASRPPAAGAGRHQSGQHLFCGPACLRHGNLLRLGCREFCRRAHLLAFAVTTSCSDVILRRPAPCSWSPQGRECRLCPSSDRILFAPSWISGFFSRFMTPRIGAVALSSGHGDAIPAGYAFECRSAPAC